VPTLSLATDVPSESPHQSPRLDLLAPCTHTAMHSCPVTTSAQRNFPTPDNCDIMTAHHFSQRTQWPHVILEVPDKFLMEGIYAHHAITSGIRLGSEVCLWACVHEQAAIRTPGGAAPVDGGERRNSLSGATTPRGAGHRRNRSSGSAGELSPKPSRPAPPPPTSAGLHSYTSL